MIFFKYLMSSLLDIPEVNIILDIILLSGADNIPATMLTCHALHNICQKYFDNTFLLHCRINRYSFDTIVKHNMNTLINHIIDCKKCLYKQKNPIEHACLHNNFNAFKKFIIIGAIPNSACLWNAIKNRHYKLAKYICSYYNKIHYTPVVQNAVINNAVYVIDFLINTSQISLDYDLIIRLSSVYDKPDILDYMLEQNLISIDDTSFLSLMIANGSLNVLIWYNKLINLKYYIRSKYIRLAIENGHLHIIKWLHKNVYDITYLLPDDTIDVIMRNNMPEIFIWLSKKINTSHLFTLLTCESVYIAATLTMTTFKTLYNYNNTSLDVGIILTNAAIYNNIDIIQYTIVHNVISDNILINTINAAAKYGHLQVLDYLQHIDKRPFLYQRAADNAAANGHIYVIIWLYNNIFHTYENICSSDAIDNASSNNDILILDWVNDNVIFSTPKCTHRAVDNAAKNGHLNVIKWLYKNVHDDEIFNINTIYTAMIHNRNDIVIWMLKIFRNIHKNNNYFNIIDNLIIVAVMHYDNDMSIFKYLYELLPDDYFPENINKYNISIIEEVYMTNDLKLIKWFYKRFFIYMNIPHHMVSKILEDCHSYQNVRLWTIKYLST